MEGSSSGIKRLHIQNISKSPEPPWRGFGLGKTKKDAIFGGQENVNSPCPVWLTRESKDSAAEALWLVVAGARRLWPPSKFHLSFILERERSSTLYFSLYGYPSRERKWHLLFSGNLGLKGGGDGGGNKCREWD